MIQIDPAPPCPELERVRDRKLSPLVERFQRDKTRPERKELEGYDKAKHLIWSHQRQKCAYCDRYEPKKHYPLDHYRPIGAATGEHARGEGYWWLAWELNNLRFTCQHCNGEKGDQFPLKQAGSALADLETPPGAEQPLLLNPYGEDPLEHLWFEKDEHGRWVPTGDDRGERSAQILGLKLLEPRYTRWVEEMLGETLITLRAALSAQDQAAVETAWRRARRLLDAPHGELRALCYCVLRAEVSDAQMTRYGLELPRPRTTRQAAAPN